jgi:radical SAM protein
MIRPATQARSNTSRRWETGPRIVFYEVTRACDLVCSHCRACAQPAADPGELTEAQSRRLVDQLLEFPEPPMLVLTGGDPLKRPDIFSLITYATAMGLEVSITPSATPLVTAAAVARLRQSGIHRMALSLDSDDADQHDAVRGVRGSFARTLEILEMARYLGLPTQVNTTLTPQNLDRIARIAQRLEPLEVVLWSVFFLVPVGRAAAATRLTAQQCELAFARLWVEAGRRPFAIKTTEAPHYRRFAMQHSRPKDSSGTSPNQAPIWRWSVNDGKGVMFVSHTGAVYPSGFLPIICGTFPRQHLVQIYQQAPLFRRLRDPDRLAGKCGRCEFRQVCGGSRARAYAVTGNPLAEEPDCQYQPGHRRAEPHLPTS